MEILKINNLYKKFNNKEVLKGLSLSIKENSIFGFVGKNGAGKTTTMKAILGLLKIDNGEIYVCGQKVKYGETKTNNYIGYLPDVPEFYSFMKPLEYLKLCGEVFNLDSDEIEKRSKELLKIVGLENEDGYIKGFSRGMKQRLGIAQALLGKPKLLICDEPTSALDPIGRKEILDVLVSVKDMTTVIFSTHILSDVERICTDVALINDGKIVMSGTIDELKKNSKEEFIVEVTNKSDVELFNCYNDIIILGNTIKFKGDNDLMNQVLEFISKNKIMINKIEKQELDLESLFVEVMSK